MGRNDEYVLTRATEIDESDLDIEQSTVHPRFELVCRLANEIWKGVKCRLLYGVSPVDPFDDLITDVCFGKLSGHEIVHGGLGNLDTRRIRRETTNLLQRLSGGLLRGHRQIPIDAHRVKGGLDKVSYDTLSASEVNWIR